MTAQILVVDDIPANVKLLEAKLTGEYYGVLTATSGLECLKITQEKKPDLILLDVMMPGIDGFETCRQIKEDPDIAHIPVVMVTALSDQSDRVKGLEAGADDFLTKPINDVALFARVRSLIRIKALLDELRLRGATHMQMGVESGKRTGMPDISGARVLLVDDDPIQAKQIIARLNEYYTAELVEDLAEAEARATSGDFDALLVSTLLTDQDGIKFAARLKSQESLRHVPILMMVDEEDTATMLKVLELGFNDYLRVPVDKNEMLARVRTQIRRRKYQELLRSNYQQSVTLAITDGLTGLYNRHYLNAHLDNLVMHSHEQKRPLALMIMDMDHFKMVNDTFGHDAGDAVLKQLADRIIKSSRSADLIARFGGEEFVVLMPETSREDARDAAERLRRHVEQVPFTLKNGEVTKTISIGVATLHLNTADTATDLLKRADEVLYQAKNGGRNRVCIAE